ncbi:MAG TPA: penicillin acylase family protein [Candidatus Baltobacteraceae bacterium]|nr:penicillin acylase family protein [Candidatus Baltobacteraceae bacterium]
MTSSSTSKRRRFPGPVSYALAALLALALLIILAWVVWIAIGLRSVSQTAGTVRIAGLTDDARIVRDDRDIPHIYASTQRDLLFAQGYAEASDRLFQMDLIRRYVYGDLSEVLGPGVLSADEHARIPDIRGIVNQQWKRLDPRERDLLIAFSDGVNAAMQREPLPVEFHILLYKPKPWRPQDSLAAGMAIALDLIDPWDDVIRRDKVARDPHAAPLHDLYAITDPAYDAPIDPVAIAPVPPLSNRSGTPHTRSAALAPYDARPPIGSNEWAVGAAHSSTGRALLANDPHLRLQIPDVWYLVDLHRGDFHVAGAALVGVPGVILGHNDNIAWGATNGTVATESLYRDPLSSAKPRKEVFHVRFAGDRTFTYYETRHGFVAAVEGKTAISVYWHGTRSPFSPLATFEGLDRAQSIAQAREVLRSYPGPPQNFVIADISGKAAYQLAGLIPDDPLWGLRVHRSGDPIYPAIPFDTLPHVAASRSAIVFTANNRMYGRGYPYRLSPNFAAPYRAHRIDELLHAQPKFSVADFTRFQGDTLSIPERDVARAAVAAVRRKHLQNDAALRPYVAQLAGWNGRFDPNSHGAAVAWELRQNAVNDLARRNAGSSAQAYQPSAGGDELVLLLRVLRERPHGWWPRDDYDGLLIGALRQAIRERGARMLQPWGEYARVVVPHALSRLGMSFLDGYSLPGDGDAYSLHVQTATHAQSFRAVWDVGNWDAGGIVIRSGESGEPGSGHYTDLGPTWVEQTLVPLPFSDGAIRAHARGTLTLQP